MGALVVGFKYRLNAAVGVSSRRGGMRSSVKGTCGSMERIDLVRKSSGVIGGGARLERDRAADLMARKDAVRFDLNADFLDITVVLTIDALSLERSSKTRKSISSISISDIDKGSSGASPSDTTDSNRLVGGIFLPRGLGVITEPAIGEASIESVRDGTESTLRARDDSTSLPASVSSSKSSGGLRSKSRGLLPIDKLNSFSETLVCFKTASTVNLCPSPLMRCGLDADFGLGIAVVASKFAMDGDNEAGDC